MIHSTSNMFHGLLSLSILVQKVRRWDGWNESVNNLAAAIKMRCGSCTSPLIVVNLRLLIDPIHSNTRAEALSQPSPSLLSDAIPGNLSVDRLCALLD